MSLALSCRPWNRINEKYMVGGYPSYRSYVRAIRAKDIILEKGSSPRAAREVVKSAVIPHGSHYPDLASGNCRLGRRKKGDWSDVT